MRGCAANTQSHIHAQDTHSSPPSAPLPARTRPQRREVKEEGRQCNHGHPQLSSPPNPSACSSGLCPTQSLVFVVVVFSGRSCPLLSVQTASAVRTPAGRCCCGVQVWRSNHGGPVDMEWRVLAGVAALTMQTHPPFLSSCTCTSFSFLPPDHTDTDRNQEQRSSVAGDEINRRWLLKLWSPPEQLTAYDPLYWGSSDCSRVTRAITATQGARCLPHHSNLDSSSNSRLQRL